MPLLAKKKLTVDDADTDSNGTLSQDELNALTIAQIRDLADEKGYELTGSTKAALIASFLEQQG